jgi:hypothetical protein
MYGLCATAVLVSASERVPQKVDQATPPDRIVL